MTKEEAIHFATCLKNNWTINFADMEDFCDMVIEALQSLSKPNNGLQGSDLIRREDIPYVDLNSDMPHSNVRVWIAFKESIDALPSADITATEECKKCQETTERVLLNARKPKHTLPDGTEIPIDEESYEIGYTHGQMTDRPTGEWVTLERDENVYDIYGVPTWGVNYMCDKCGFITTAIQDHFGQYKFCPNCGAKMGGDDE